MGKIKNNYTWAEIILGKDMNIKNQSEMASFRS